MCNLRHYRGYLPKENRIPEKGTGWKIFAVMCDKKNKRKIRITSPYRDEPIRNSFSWSDAMNTTRHGYDYGFCFYLDFEQALKGLQYFHWRVINKDKDKHSEGRQGMIALCKKYKIVGGFK